MQNLLKKGTNLDSTLEIQEEIDKNTNWPRNVVHGECKISIGYYNLALRNYYIDNEKVQRKVRQKTSMSSLTKNL